MAFKIFLYFLLASYFGIACGHSSIARSSSSGSSGTGTAPQTCGTDNNKFYCPVDELCKPRSQRCTHANVCNNPQTNKEDGCYESTTYPGLYEVRLGHAKLGLLGSKQYALEHQFIVYRGFTYEFGKSYGVQILDTADPQYKYHNGMNLNSNGIETVDYSYCTWDDATKFANKWNDEYSLWSNNCQHFTDALKEYLTTSSCNKPQSNRVKREDGTADLDQEINNILQNCSIVCCDNEGNAVSPIMMISIILFSITVAVIPTVFFQGL